MKKLRLAIRKFLDEEFAATAVEYAVLLALILTVIIGAIGNVGAETGKMWGGIEDDLESVNFIQ